MRVLVLDGNENQAVACVRSLGRAGHHVTVAADARWSKAGWSRWCNETCRYPHPEQDAERFVDAIVMETARRPGTFVLPMTERTVLPLSRERSRILAAGGRLVLPSHAAVLRAFDKHETTALAQSLGVAVPRTVTVTTTSGVREHAPGLRYPVVVKPRSSQEIVSPRRLRTTGAPLYARDPAELVEAWSRIAARCGSALIQEFVEGDGVGFFALMRHGRLRAEFAHRRLRDVRPTGSGSSLRVSIEPDPVLREQAVAILESLEWHGPAMVEFRVTADGTPYFLEVNGRFWNSLALAVHAGVDFPALIAALAEHGDVPAASRYRAGVRCRWLLGDARHLVEVWRGAPAGYPGRFPRRWPTFAAVMTPRRGTCHDNFELSDPLPELGDWVDFALRRLPRRVREGGGASLWHAKGNPSHP